VTAETRTSTQMKEMRKKNNNKEEDNGRAEASKERVRE
jgi:hypothetical protein